MDENVSLKVRKGPQIFGPMSLVQLAELLASGRIAESDEVSADGRSWSSITAYFEQQMAAESPPPVEEPVPAPPATDSAEQEEDDFLPSFDVADTSDGPPSTLFDDDNDDEIDDDLEVVDEEEEHEPVPAIKRPKKKRKRRRPVQQFDDDEDDDEDEPESDPESSNLDDVLRKLLEHERSAPALNEPRSKSMGGGGAAASVSMKMTPKERRDGFVMLFNGKNFSGWRFRESSALPATMPDNWKAEKGCILLTGGGKPALMSQWDYADFDLRFVWRASSDQYNTGLCIRSERKIGRNQICMRQGHEGTFRGGEIDGAENIDSLQKPAGQWNEWRVVAEGDSVTLWCNGKEAWMATGLDPEPGYLGFLAAGSQIEFTNLRIKEMGCDYLKDLKEYWTPVDDKQSTWKQMGDSLVGDKGKSSPLETLDSDYQNFVLRLDYKLTKSAVGTLYLRGADCAEAAVNLGGGEKGSGGLPGIHIEPEEKLDNPDGQWNFLEARVLNNVIAIRLNGEEIVEKAKLPRGGTSAPSGPIGLAHNGRPIQFRNIRIRKIDERGKKRGRLFGR